MAVPPLEALALKGLAASALSAAVLGGKPAKAMALTVAGSYLAVKSTTLAIDRFTETRKALPASRGGAGGSRAALPNDDFWRERGAVASVSARTRV